MMTYDDAQVVGLYQGLNRNPSPGYSGFKKQLFTMDVKEKVAG